MAVRSSKKIPWRAVFFSILTLLVLYAGISVLDLFNENQILHQQLIIQQNNQATQGGSSDAQTSLTQNFKRGDVPLPVTSDHRRGSSSASLVLIEYADYDCPFCQAFFPTVQALRSHYGDQLAWVYRQYPLDIHPHAQLKAEIAECVANQDGEEAFWKATDHMFTHIAEADQAAVLAGLAREGIMTNGIAGCIQNNQVVAKIAQSKLDIGTEIHGTPGVYIIKNDGSGISFAGALPISTYEKVIDTLLNN